MKTFLRFYLMSMLCLLAYSGGKLDVRHYPGIPSNFTAGTDRLMLDAKHWKSEPDFKIISDCDGLTVSSGVPVQWSHELVAADRFPVVPGKLLKVTSRFYLTKVDTGSLFVMTLQLLNKDGGKVGAEQIAEARNASPEKLIFCEQYVRVPANAVFVRPTVKFSGNPMTVKIVSLEVKEVKAKDPMPVFPHRIPFSNQCLTDEELTQALMKRSKPVIKVQTDGDLVRYMVNGKAVPLKIYKNNLTTTIANYPEFLKKTPAMQKAGFNLFTVGVYMGLPCHPRTANSVWMKDGSYQVDVICKAMRQILKYSPDAMIMLEFFITPHEGWSEANQDEVVQWVDGRKAVFSGGGRIRSLTHTPPEVLKPIPHEPWSMPIWIPSYFSEKFTEEAGQAIYDIFTELERRPESHALAGVFITRGVDMQWFDLFAEIPATATEEAIYPLADYSPASRKYFQDFIRRKYDGDINKVRAAWNEAGLKSFEEIQVPSHDELFAKGKGVLRKSGGRDRIADFIESRGDGMARQFTSFARAIKRATGGRVMVGGYRAEGAIVSWPFLVQQCSKQMYASDDVDFFASCPGGRTPENPVMPSLLNGSLRLHGKIGVTEMDFRNPWVWNWGRWGESFYYKTHDEQEFRQRTLRAQLFASAFGGAFHAYDMDGYWYDNPMSLKAWTRNNQIYDRRQPRPLTDDRIALLYSEHYWEYMALNSNRAFAHIVKNSPREAVVRSGVDCDNYLLDDVFHPFFPAPKVLWFVDAVELTAEQAAEIRRRYANSGRVLVWMWAPGVGVSPDVGAVAGFKLRKAPEADGKPVVAIPGCKDPLMAGVNNLLLSRYQPWGMGPVWAVEDPAAIPLGKYLGTNLTGMAVKRYPDHTEIFIGQAGNMTHTLVRNVAREAKAHCWLDTGDAVASAGNLLIVSVTVTGNKCIKLPAENITVKCLTGQDILQQGKEVHCYLEYEDVLVLEMTEE